MLTTAAEGKLMWLQIYFFLETLKILVEFLCWTRISVRPVALRESLCCHSKYWIVLC